MKCPCCKSGALQAFDAEPGLRAHGCERCAGQWIPYTNYLSWLESTGVIAKAKGSKGVVGETAVESAAVRSTPLTQTKLTSPDISEAVAARVRLCPGCGRYLRKMPLGHGIAFEVDRCAGCGGIWCDSGEWPALRSTGIHNRLHLLFSDSWQNKLHDDAVRQRQEDRVRTLLGDADFERARDFKLWLDGHAHRSTLHAYLAENPHGTTHPSGH